MSTHPYAGLPDHAFWARSIARTPISEVDPVVAVPFRLTPNDRIATAGSCFAQHISRCLQGNGFNYLVTEPPHPIFSEDDARLYNYGTFSARYGNIYTARQLRQLFDRAYGHFAPADDVWAGPDGTLIDPFRPRIQPDGFSSPREFAADRNKHFAAVRRMFEELDVFVFTFGLTEAWASAADGSVFPLCPGVAGGTFDSERHSFHNYGVQETVEDMTAFVTSLRRVNAAARIILTVSPVPLVATAEPRHVLVSTTYSKSVLRVACEMLAGALDDVAYFPSYEIITGNFSRGSYFAPDCRSVTPAGVSHVMRVFLRHYAGVESAHVEQVEARTGDSYLAEMARIAAVDCDEQVLDES
jgi:hypothetical protein